MLEGKPTFKKDNLLYERQEKEGYYTFVSKLHPETMELIINPTGKQILTLCDGTKTLQEIAACMKERYADVAENTIRLDVHKTVASFSRLGVIEWEGENPFLLRREEPISQDLFLVIGQEEDMIAIKTFLESLKVLQSPLPGRLDHFLYRSPLCKPVEYEEVSLRQRLFAYAEEFFLLLRKGKISGLVSISTPSLGYSSAVVRIIISPRDAFVSLMRYAQDNFLYLTVREVTKMSILELSQEPLDADLRRELFAEGYKEEGIFLDEMGFGGDVTVIARRYNPALVERIDTMKAGA